MTRTTTCRSTLLRRLIMVAAAAGLLGAALQAQAHVERDRLALEARVEAMREAISAASSDEHEADPRAAWFNWGNWNNWNNWSNWGNWANWANHR